MNKSSNFETLLQMLNDLENDRGNMNMKALFEAYVVVNNAYHDYINEVVLNEDV